MLQAPRWLSQKLLLAILSLCTRKINRTYIVTRFLAYVLSLFLWLFGVHLRTVFSRWEVGAHENLLTVSSSKSCWHFFCYNRLVPTKLWQSRTQNNHYLCSTCCWSNMAYPKDWLLNPVFRVFANKVQTFQVILVDTV